MRAQLFPRQLLVDWKTDAFFLKISKENVFSLVPDLLFDCWRVLEYAKMRTVLQSKLLGTNKEYGIDPVFTDTAAILNLCPGGMSTFRLYFRVLFGTFFLKVLLE